MTMHPPSGTHSENERLEQRVEKRWSSSLELRGQDNKEKVELAAQAQGGGIPCPAV